MTRRSALAAGLLSPLALASCQPSHTITGEFTGASPERGHLLRGAFAVQKPAVTRTVHTLIAGGGVAGLSAARGLRLKGIDDFAVLELDSEAGGNARAGSMAGMPHPIGAHYLPVPSDAAPETQDFLEELGLRKRIAGRWQYDERHLCHSPQERLFIQGAWQEGLLPMAGVGKDTLAQYAQFSQLVARWRQTGGFQIPVSYTAVAQNCMAQLAMSFVAYLDAQGLTDPVLRWYLDYCCRDDYGSGMQAVSAWAGIHYFAARHGFSAPANAGLEHSIGSEADSHLQQAGVLTWPEGNAYLTRALAQPLADRLYTGRAVLRITQSKNHVTIDALNIQTQQLERWQAQQCVVALPAFIAHRVVDSPPDFLRQTAQHTSYASWLVANVHINAALSDAGGGHGGAAPAWDNVIYNPAVSDAGPTGGLGYVDAMHQSTRTASGPSVLTYYRALGGSQEARRGLLAKPWTQHRDETLADLAVAHPDIAQRAMQMNISRYGHAMAIPTPEFISKIALQPNRVLRKQLLNRERKGFGYAVGFIPRTQRLSFAHSDWAGYSVFEEAFRLGLQAV